MAVPRAQAGPWEDGISAYAAGDYSAAVSHFEEALRTEGPSAARYYNLGSALALQGKTGPAVLALERAAWLSPRSRDIQAGLEKIRPVSSSHPQQSARGWQAPFYWLSLQEWSWLLTFTLSGLALFFAIRAWVSRQSLPPRPWVRGISLTGLILAGISGWALQFRSGERHAAILTASEPVLRISPIPNADPIDGGATPPGQWVTMGAVWQDWVFVTLPNSGASGWIPASQAPALLPSS